MTDEEYFLKIAMPIKDGKLSAHLGQYDSLRIFYIGRRTRYIVARKECLPPNHQLVPPPEWIHYQRSTLVITGGIGARARNLLTQHRVGILIGNTDVDPEELVASYLDNRFQTGQNHCAQTDHTNEG